jgi:hypothetical protein
MTQAERIKKAVGEFGALAKAKLNEGGNICARFSDQRQAILANFIGIEQRLVRVGRHLAKIETEFIVGHAVTITKLFHETNSRTAKAVGRFLDFNRARMTA